MSVKAVVFDLDGTLTDFNLDFRAVRAEVIHYLTSQGFPASIFSMNESFLKMLEKAEIYMKNNGKKDEEVAKVKAAVFNIVNKYELEAARRTNLKAGALETLKTLKEMNLKLGLCTINGQKSTNYIFEAFRLKNFFDAVVTRELTSKVKPNSSHLETALKTLGVKPEEAVIVGDSVIDVKCGQESSVIAVGVTTGLSTPEELTHSGATHVIKSLTELPHIIRQINTTK